MDWKVELDRGRAVLTEELTSTMEPALLPSGEDMGPGESPSSTTWFSRPARDSLTHFLSQKFVCFKGVQWIFILANYIKWLNAS